MSKNCKNCGELTEKLQEVKEELNECRFDRNLAQLEAHQYKQALDEIEKIVSGTYYETEQTIRFKMQDIQDVIGKAKEK